MRITILQAEFFNGEYKYPTVDKVKVFSEHIKR